MTCKNISGKGNKRKVYCNNAFVRVAVRNAYLAVGLARSWKNKKYKFFAKDSLRSYPDTDGVCVFLRKEDDERNSFVCPTS